jgi:ABC-type cobalamin/Fe3+-siderophores transport system ATPase subunit
MAKKIISLIKDIQVERNLTIIISEHRLDLVLPFAEQIILMKNGEVIEYNSRDDVINGTYFQNLKLNKPVIYTIFNRLKNENLFPRKIPASIPAAIDSIKKLQ